jgi:hypothetical protein
MSFSNNGAGSLVAGAVQSVVLSERGRSLRAAMIRFALFLLAPLAFGIAFASIEAMEICSAALKANFCP